MILSFRILYFEGEIESSGLNITEVFLQCYISLCTERNTATQRDSDVLLKCWIVFFISVDDMEYAMEDNHFYLSLKPGDIQTPE